MPQTAGIRIPRASLLAVALLLHFSAAAWAAEPAPLANWQDAGGIPPATYSVPARYGLGSGDPGSPGTAGAALPGIRNKVGHQGLFFERFDGLNTDPALVPTDATAVTLSAPAGRGKGLYYNRWRWYDSHLGRFCAKDPLYSSKPLVGPLVLLGRPLHPFVAPSRADRTASLGPNIFEYLKENPLCYRDPSGLLTLTDMMEGVGYACLYAQNAIAGSRLASALVQGVMSMVTAYNAYLLATDPDYLFLLTTMPGGIGMANGMLNAAARDARAIIRAAGGALEIGAAASISSKGALLVGFSSAEVAMIRRAEATLRSAGIDTSLLRVLQKVDDMPSHYRGMSLGDDGAALGNSAFSSESMLVHVLEEEILHLVQRAQGLTTEFGPGTAIGLEGQVDGIRQFPVPPGE